MGNKLKNIYNQVKEKYGEIGLYRLIVKTRISPELAGDLEDSDVNLEKVNSAIMTLGFNYTSHEEVKSRRGFLRRLLSRRS